MNFWSSVVKALTPTKVMMSDYERYLAKSTDLRDLERREREWMRGKR